MAFILALIFASSLLKEEKALKKFGGKYYATMIIRQEYLCFICGIKNKSIFLAVLGCL
jgi:hypothetical protein